jgi:hypothetical protein
MFGKSTFFALAFAGCLISPVQSFAQGAADAGVSGIPRGPGSAGGLNNSVNDPSGIGNAPRALPPPALNPSGSSIPSGFPPAVSRISPRPRVVVTRGPRHIASASRRRSSRTNAMVSAHDKLLDRKLKSICSGC